jgi:hypothetical protein
MDVNGGFIPNGMEFLMWLARAICLAATITKGSGMYRVF